MPSTSHSLRSRAVTLVLALVVGQTGAADDADRRAAAFAMFERLPAVVDLPAGDPHDPFNVVGSDRRSLQVDLGPLPLEDLAAVSFRLATPKESIAGQPFQAEVAAVDEAAGGRSWEIRHLDRAALGGGARSERLATLTELDGRLILQVERPQLGSRALAILRRCVILAEALDPATQRLAVREIRLVTPTRIRPLLVHAEDGRRLVTLAVPNGIGSRDTLGGRATVNLALPVNGVELEARWGGQPVTMRWPRPAGDPSEPGVGRWRVAVADLDGGAQVGMKVTLSLPRATLECTPTLMEAPGGEFSEEAWATFQERQSVTTAAIEKKFRARVAACPLRDYRRSSGRDGPADLFAAWFEAPLATEQAMAVAMRGHETPRSSLDLYLKEEYERVADELREQWERKTREMPAAKTRDTTEYFGPPRPAMPKDFEAWQQQWPGAKQDDWETLFTARLDAWSDWFWQRFQARWKERQATATEALSKPRELQIVGITSIARDAAGVEYRVPLVVGSPAVAPLGGVLPAQPPPPEARKRGIPPEVVTP